MSLEPRRQLRRRKRKSDQRELGAKLGTMSQAEEDLNRIDQAQEYRLHNPATLLHKSAPAANHSRQDGEMSDGMRQMCSKWHTTRDLRLKRVPTTASLPMRFLRTFSPPTVSLVFAILLFQFAISQLAQSIERSQQSNYQHSRQRQHLLQQQITAESNLGLFESSLEPQAGDGGLGAQLATSSMHEATTTTSSGAGERGDNEFAPKANGK